MSDKLFEIGDDPVIDETKTYLPELVGEGKQYKDHEALAKAALFKEAHIKKLEAENDEFRKELKVRTTLEEFMEKMKTTPPPENKRLDENRNTNSDDPPDDSKTLKAVEELLDKKLAEKDLESVTSGNLSAVLETLRQAWGSGFQTELKRKTRELGLGEDFATNLASTQPKAFLKLFDVKAEKEELNLRTRGTPPVQGDSAKNYKYYEKLRKEKPDEYYQKQTEIFDQAKLLGDAFYA